MEPYTDEITDAFWEIVPTEGEDWEILGVISRDREIHALGNDSKILGRIFEIVSSYYIKAISQKLGMKFYESKKQTIYPDFYLIKDNGRRIAIDIKSTYRKFKANGEVSNFSFTQGSFTSYLRNGTKNIDGNYNLYDSHYIAGFVYTRDESASEGIFSIDDLDGIVAPYRDIEIIFMEKFRIGGDKKGSGNTDNIATISSNSVEAFNYGAGPFSFLGKDVYEHYWRNYPRYSDSEEVQGALFNNLPTYFRWLRNKGDVGIANELETKYSEYKEFINEKGWSVTISEDTTQNG